MGADVLKPNSRAASTQDREGRTRGHDGWSEQQAHYYSPSGFTVYMMVGPRVLVRQPAEAGCLAKAEWSSRCHACM